MKKMILISAIAMTAAGTTTFAQEKLVKNQQSQTQKEFHRAYFGLGLGMEYGGIGFNVEYVPMPYVGVFAGVGYNLQGIGLNAGASFKPLPFARITPTIIGMYGYNAVIYVAGATKYNKSYYGPTIGIGGELKVGRRQNKLKAAIYYPIRSAEVKRDYDELKKDPYITLNGEMLPITYSIGFHFVLK